MYFDIFYTILILFLLRFVLFYFFYFDTFCILVLFIFWYFLYFDITFNLIVLVLWYYFYLDICCTLLLLVFKYELNIMSIHKQGPFLLFFLLPVFFYFLHFATSWRLLDFELCYSLLLIIILYYCLCFPTSWTFQILIFVTSCALFHDFATFFLPFLLLF